MISGVGHTLGQAVGMRSADLYLVIREDGSQQGPASVEVLKEWMVQGAIQPQTQLKSVATGETILASELPGIYTVQAPTSVTPPPQIAPQAAYPRESPQKQAEAYSALDMLVPVRADIFAVAAGYFGLFSLVVVGAPFALIFGVIALRRIKQNPNRTGKGRAWFGIIMGSLVLSLAAFALLASVLGRS